LVVSASTGVGKDRGTMLQQVDIGAQSLDAYRRSAGAEVVEELRSSAKPLLGARVLHINATPSTEAVSWRLPSAVRGRPTSSTNRSLVSPRRP
jgi:hypothetical protein